MATKTKKPTRVKKTSTRARTAPMSQEPAAMVTPPAPPAPAPSPVNNILVLVLIVLAFFAGYFYFKAQNLEKGGVQTAGTQQEQPAATNLKIKKPSTDEPWRGNKDAPVVMVEYSDLECPFCKRIHPDLQKLFNENGGNLAWVYRHFPLSFHPKAQKSGEATECAYDELGNEGFWKMTDAIYEKMPAMELTELPAIAASIGANQATFQQCLDSGKTAKRVTDDQAEGTKIGVQATPTTVFYNMKTGKSQTVEGAVPFDQLKQAYEAVSK